MATLFTADDLSGYLRTEITVEQAAAVERIVWGWLSGATGLTERPDTIPADLYSWAIELAAMAYDNPTSLSTRQVDDVVMTMTEERRQTILREAGSASDVASSGSPRGSFPDAQCWPDPPWSPFAGNIIYTP